MPAPRLEPFAATHAGLMAGRYGAQAWLEPYFTELETLAAAEAGFAFTALCGEVFIGCGGLCQIHAFRAIAWAILAPGNPQHFRWIHHRMREGLREGLSRYPRIEAYLDPEFPQASRWAKLLGFRQEGEIKPYYLSDGRSGVDWVMIRGEP